VNFVTSSSLKLRAVKTFAVFVPLCGKENPRLSAQSAVKRVHWRLIRFATQSPFYGRNTAAPDFLAVHG